MRVLKLICISIIFIECCVLYAVILDISWCNNMCFYASLLIIELFIVWEAFILVNNKPNEKNSSST